MKDPTEIPRTIRQKLPIAESRTSLYNTLVVG